MRALLLVAALALAGCKTLPERVSVPIPVGCVKERPQRPPLVTDAELAVMSDGQFVLALGRDRVLRQGYEGELEAVVDACAASGPAPTTKPK